MMLQLIRIALKIEKNVANHGLTGITGLLFFGRLRIPVKF